MSATWKPISSSSGEAHDLECVVTREEFLARCPLAQGSKASSTTGEKARSTTTSKSNVRKPAPPPGLASAAESLSAPPPGMGQEVKSETRKSQMLSSMKSSTGPQPAPATNTKKKSVSTTLSPADAWTPYQVLFCGLPEPMLNETMLFAMFEQSKLEKGVDSIRVQNGGKVVVNFKSSEFVQRSISQFNGRIWGGSMVIAQPVHTVKAEHKAPKPVGALRADEPMYVRTSFSAEKKVTPKMGKLSADAPVFVPAAQVKQGGRQRANSDLSTEADEASSGHVSES